MDYYAGIDVSLEASSVCLVDSAAKIIRETKVTSDPDALIEHFVSLGLALKRIGLECVSAWCLTPPSAPTVDLSHIAQTTN